ncbi:MAG: family 43 glycosylhydrolase [Petrimonas sp.]|nr:family 43 glycosylhydrolase [Petrimonas sp.]
MDVNHVGIKKIICLSVYLLFLFSLKTFAQPVADKDLYAYLFTYFTGNKQEQEAINYAVSLDGYKFYALNGNKPVIDSRKISFTGGVRDPHILRTQEGNFCMVATDMVSANGWNSNRGMVLLKSDDLVNWTSKAIDIQKRFSGNEHLLRVWAPQTIYDPDAGKYLIYWSMKHGENPDIIYYAYANNDFTDLETEPKQLFFPKNGRSCIDGDIILKDSVFHIFYKTEDAVVKGIKHAITCSLTSGKWKEFDDYVQQTNDAVEGSGIYKLNHSDDYILMYDVYGKGRYQFTESSDLMKFKVVDDKVAMDFHPRHGTVMPITRKELQRLYDAWGKPAALPAVTDKNPVIEGYYADPEILYSENTKKYYLYPTSDGFDGWSGYYFKTFSSDNLKDWTDEGVILNLKKDVPWAGRNAWAPSIIEKKTGRNSYKYYYYYTGAQKIGVAVSNNPAGPFADSGKPLIATKPAGINRGQEIDPDVFYDPVSRKDYLYWGNGYLAVVELNKDMISLKPKTMKVITPDNTFREGVYVFYRKGIYYFLWSENDTRSEDYRVRYGTSKSPLGPIHIPDNNLILEKNPSDGIYGTGHNSVLQIPGKDEWYIVYHRFNRPNGIKMGPAAGFHREVCMDKLEFNNDGSIKKVTPAL